MPSEMHLNVIFIEGEKIKHAAAERPLGLKLKLKCSVI